MLSEMRSSLLEILKINSIDWLSDEEINLIVLESESHGINNSEDLSSFVMMESQVFKDSLC